MINLGLICHEYPPSPHGGIGSFCEDFAEGLTELGHVVTVLGIGTAVDHQAGNVAVKLLAPTSIRRPWRFHLLYDRWRFGRWIQAQHRLRPFDLFEVPDYEGWLPNGLPLGVPVIARLHGSNWLYDTELKRPGDAATHEVEKKTLLKANFWAGVSHFAYQRSLELCELKHKPGQVIHNAVDATLFAPSPVDKTERGLIVFVNSLNRRKGLDTLLRAMKLVLPTQPEARLAVIGSPPAKMDEWENLLAGLTASDRRRIQFVGRQDRRTQVVDWLQRAEVCCYPSRVETFGLAPVEAMATGKATIYANLGPGPEVIEDGISGLLCDPENPADLADKLLRILRDQNFGRQLGAAARKKVLAQFDRRHWLDRNLNFYRDCRTK